MARNPCVIFTFATLLFLLVTSSHARSSSDQTENDVSPTTISSDHNSDPKTTTTIILPSEKPQTQPATLVELEPEETETVDPKDSAQKKSDAQTDSVTLTAMTFRPIKRHFARRPFRRGHRCHGRRHHHFDQYKSQRSYGDDMIISGGKAFGLDRQKATRWARFHLGGHKFPSADDRQHHHHHREDREVKEHKHDRYYNGGFTKGIRKFLDNF